MAREDDRHVVPLILLAQSVVSIGLAAVAWALIGADSALAIVLGGMAAVIPNAFLAARLLGLAPRADARALMRAAWLGEIGKLLLTVLAFVGIFTWIRPNSAAAVFCGFIAAQSIVLGALLWSGGAFATVTESKS